MSIVSVQLGQCGNQIGNQLFSTVMQDLAAGHSKKAEEEEYRQVSVERFFHVMEDESGKEKTPEARAVMVDMEQKVINQSVSEAKRSGSWRYPSKQQFCQKRGSGNNWAHGYCSHGPVSKEPVIEMARKEVEKCDHFGGFLAIQSLAGGTGSGVGTYISQALREEFPHCFLLNQVVWPYNTGEVIVQNYNALLTLSHLYQCSDAVLVTSNDHLHKICSQLMALRTVSFQDINQVIAHQMAALLQPAYPVGRSALVRNVMGDLLTELVAHPQYKLLSLRSIPQVSERSRHYSTHTWPGLLKHLRQMLIADAPMEEGINWQVKASSQQGDFNHSLANLLVLRGADLQTADTQPFQEPRLYPSWMPPDGAFLQWNQSRPFNNYGKSAVLLSNSQSPVMPLDSLLEKAWSMFASRAYIHQYLKHGLSEEDFVDSFACLEQVVASYKSLGPFHVF